MLSRTATLANIVLDHAECARVFQRHRLDYGCDGGMSLEVAVRQRGLDVERVLEELQGEVANRDADDAQPDLRALSMQELVARAVSLHHVPLRRSTPLVCALAVKAKEVHGPREPSLVALAERVEALAAALLPHLEDESQVMFPALLASTERTHISQLIALAERDHRAITALLFEVRERANDYELPEWASSSYRTLLSELRWLENDVLALVHLETHVLQPRFLAGGAGP